MELIASKLKEFLGTFGWDAKKMDVIIKYNRDERGVLIGTINIVGPIIEG